MKFRRKPREDVSVNLTPLIDVVFLLLIFFMVSTTFSRESQLSINLPDSKGSESAASEEHIRLNISADGRYELNGTLLPDTKPETLRAAVKALGLSTELPFQIAADAATPHQQVVTAMDEAARLGYIRLTITTQAGDSPP